MLIFSPQTLQPGHPRLLLWQWQSGVRKSLLLCLRWRDPVLQLLSPGQRRWQSSWRLPYAGMRGDECEANHFGH